MSAEPGRKRAYSTDIRLWIVHQRTGMGLTFYEIARNLNIAISTAHRIFKQFETSGDSHTGYAKVQARDLIT